jgi:sugar lactone lactonase YvrE
MLAQQQHSVQSRRSFGALKEECMPRQFAFAFIGLCLSLAMASASAANLVVYDDQSKNGFNDGCSFGGVAGDFNVANTVPVHSGTHSIRFTPDNFNAVSWCAPATYSAATDFTGIDFWVSGGTTGGQNVDVVLSLGASKVKFASLTALNGGNAIAQAAWTHIQATFTAGVLAYSGQFDKISLQDESGVVQANMYFDDVSLVSGATQNSIFTDGFDPELMFAPQYQANSIQVYQRVLHPAPNAADFTLIHTAPLASVAGNAVVPNAVAFAPDGNLWVVDAGNVKRLLRYTQASIVSSGSAAPDVIVGPVGAGAGDIFDLAFFGTSAYVSQSDFGGTNHIVKFAASDLNLGNNVSTNLTNASLSTPAGLAFDAQGRLWITNNGNNTIVRMNTSSGTIDKTGTNVGTPGGRNALNNAEGLAFDQYGSLWVGNNGEPTISAYADWQLSDAAFGATVPVYQLDIAPGIVQIDPNVGFVGGLAFDRGGNLWANYEYSTSVLEYVLMSFPRGGALPGVGSYMSTPQPQLNSATTNPGFGGVAFWPVLNSLHR